VLPQPSSVWRTGCGQSDVARWSCRSHPGAGSVAEQMRPPTPRSPLRGGFDPGGHSPQLTVTTAREWRTRPWKPLGPKALAAAPAGSLHVSRLKGKDTTRALIAGVMPKREAGPVWPGQPEHLHPHPHLHLTSAFASASTSTSLPSWPRLEGRGWGPP
jgi:hypothetical protein